MKKTFFYIFHLPRPKRTCLSVTHIVPFTFIENHWSLLFSWQSLDIWFGKCAVSMDDIATRKQILHGNLNLQMQWEGRWRGVEWGMRHHQVNSKKDSHRSFHQLWISLPDTSKQNLRCRNWFFRQYIFWCLVQCERDSSVSCFFNYSILPSWANYCFNIFGEFCWLKELFRKNDPENILKNLLLSFRTTKILVCNSMNMGWIENKLNVLMSKLAMFFCCLLVQIF